MAEAERVEPAEVAEEEKAESTPAEEPKEETKAEETEAPEEHEEKPKPKGGFQRRIDELTRNWREAERRNEELMSMLKQHVAPQKEVKPPEPPTLEQHGYDESKYQAALTEYVRGLTRDEARAVFEQTNAEAQKRTRQEAFRQREAEFAATVEDYADKVYDPSLPLSETVVGLIADSDIGPKVAYYLAENPDVARSMYELSPTSAAREFGKLEARLSITQSQKPVSKAPPPPPKLSANEPEVEKDPDQMTTKEWLKWREKQIKNKR